MGSRVSSVVSSFHSGVIYSTKLRCLFIAQTVATKHHASVNLVYDSIASGDGCAEENRTEFNCTLKRN